MPKNESTPFPGRLIKLGETDKSIVLTIQKRLNQLGCGPIAENGVFDEITLDAVKLFQSRSVDSNNNSLVIDGKIGSLTWGALFKTDTATPGQKAASKLLNKVIEIAATQVGVRERPLGSNDGPEVRRYLASVGLDSKKGSFAWCVAFIYFCFQQAADELSRSNPMVKTAGVLDHWNRAKANGAIRILAKDAIADPSLIQPGQIFVIAIGSKGLGHSGLVTEVLPDGRFKTIEGNSNDGGSREGIGVFERERKPTEINRGFVDYSGV